MDLECTSGEEPSRGSVLLSLLVRKTLCIEYGNTKHILLCMVLPIICTFENWHKPIITTPMKVLGTLVSVLRFLCCYGSNLFLTVTCTVCPASQEDKVEETVKVLFPSTLGTWGGRCIPRLCIYFFQGKNVSCCSLPSYNGCMS